MSNLEKRIATLELEQADKLRDAQSKMQVTQKQIDDLMREINEILTRKRPLRSNEEITEDNKARLKEMRIASELRYANK